MQIILNGKQVEIEKEMTLAEFIRIKDLEPERIVLEHNFDIARREDWDRIVLKENDRLEVLKFVGGG